jgi:UDP-3-O-[3-hydroxymyristoyl] glucosamine N-acyltransferase
MPKTVYTLAEIAELIGGTLQGDPDCEVSSIASLGKAQAGQISFLAGSRYQLVASSRYEKLLPLTKAQAVILSSEHASLCPVHKLIVADPMQSYLKVAALFERKTHSERGIHCSAEIGENCQIANTASIGANCVIGGNCQIGDGTTIAANVVIMDNTCIGSESVIYPNVTIYHDVIIGNRVTLHAGVVIGARGFGLARDAKGWQKIPHLGSVRIGDDVEVGANTTIDRGAIDDTIIGNGVKLDNLIMIAHGVSVGDNTVIAGCTGVAGSTHIGANCMIGGATGIGDNIVIADNVIFAGMSQVTKSIEQPGIYASGTGILSQKAWHKNIARLRNLDDMAKKLRKLEKEHNE